MPSIDVNITGQKFILRGDEDEQHLAEVAEIVRRKIENLRQKNNHLSMQKAAMLVAFDLASELIKGRKKALHYRTEVLSKTTSLLERVEGALG